MTEIQLIGDYFLIRQVQSLNLLQQILQQSEGLANHEVVTKLLKNMEQTCRKLTDDILLLIPLESRTAWNDPEKLLRVVNELRKNLSKEDIELVQDAVRVTLSSGCQQSRIQKESHPKPTIKENQSKPICVNRKVQSFPPMIKNKVTAELNGKRSEGKLTQTGARNCGEIQNILAAQTRIATQHQQTKQNCYENWPLNFNKEQSKSETESESKSNSKSNSKTNSRVNSQANSRSNSLSKVQSGEKSDLTSDKQPNDTSIKRITAFFPNNIRFFVRKPRIDSTFYVDLTEYHD